MLCRVAIGTERHAIVMVQSQLRRLGPRDHVVNVKVLGRRALNAPLTVST
jgi:hypothetical protein